MDKTPNPDRTSVSVEARDESCRATPGTRQVISLAGSDRAEQQAREAVWSACSESLGTRLPDALLVVSELVTNAVSHTTGVRDLELRSDGHVTELTVRDEGGTANWPRVTDANLLAESGRGMRLVDALADSWHARRDSAGKAVTAVFRNEHNREV